MTKAEAVKAIRTVDGRINASRRAKDSELEGKLFRLRGWLQVVRSCAGDRYSRRSFDEAVAQVKTLQDELQV